MLVGMASLPHSHPPEQRHFTVETGKTAYWNFSCYLESSKSQPNKVILFLLMLKKISFWIK